MRKIILPAFAFMLAIGAAGTAQAGCLSGAAVGGVAGHFVGSGHGLVGAAVGCVAGRHISNRNEAARQHEMATQVHGRRPSQR